MKNKLFLAIMALFIAGVLAACSGGDEESSSEGESSGEKEEYVLKLPHIVQEDHPANMAAEVFKEEAEKNSDGRIKVEIFPNGELYGSDRELIEAIQLGNADVSMVGTPSMGNFDESFYVIDLPFLFSDRETAREALSGDLGDKLNEGLADINLKSLGYGYDGFRNFMNNVRPIESPEDMEGLKMRVQESDIQQDIFNELGANASPLAFGELYSALQQNTYDGMDNSLKLTDTSKFYEVQKYLTISKHQYSATIILINNKLFEGMPSDLQDVIVDAGKKMEEAYYKGIDEANDETLVKFKDEKLFEGINELTPEQLQKFIDKTKPVYEKYADIIGQDLIDLAKSYSEE